MSTILDNDHLDAEMHYKGSITEEYLLFLYKLTRNPMNGVVSELS